MTKSRLALPCLDASSPRELTVTCVADNGHGQLQSSTKVRLDTTAGVNVRCAAKEARAVQPPRIAMWTDGRFELFGRNAQLFCRATGVPAPTVHWVDGDGQRVKDGARFQQLPNGDLLIRASEATAADAAESPTGVYTCVATNAFGEQDRAEAFFYATAVSEWVVDPHRELQPDEDESTRRV